MSDADRQPPARITGRTLGSPRNGLPPTLPYVYRGTGVDVLTPSGTQWQRDLERGTAAPESTARPARRTGSGRAPAPPRAVSAPCPEPAPVPVVTETPAAPRRCGTCGYLVTAAGHTITCGEG